jgi:hypothetical protein
VIKYTVYALHIFGLLLALVGISLGIMMKSFSQTVWAGSAFVWCLSSSIHYFLLTKNVTTDKFCHSTQVSNNKEKT